MIITLMVNATFVDGNDWGLTSPFQFLEELMEFLEVYGGSLLILLLVIFIVDWIEIK